MNTIRRLTTDILILGSGGTGLEVPTRVAGGLISVRHNTKQAGMRVVSS